jgi:hypothetical protein
VKEQLQVPPLRCAAVGMTGCVGAEELVADCCPTAAHLEFDNGLYLGSQALTHYEEAAVSGHRDEWVHLGPDKG